MTDIAAWLLAIYDQQEKVARAATPGPWRRYGMAGVTTPEWDVVYEGPVVCEDCDWRVTVTGVIDGPTAEHVALHDPTAVLADIAAKKAIVELHRPEPPTRSGQVFCGRCENDYSPCPEVRLLASAHADKPGYQQEWAVET